MDKAGAYATQRVGSRVGAGIVGDYYTVVGFPIGTFLDLLLRSGWQYKFRSLFNPTRVKISQRRSLYERSSVLAIDQGKTRYDLSSHGGRREILGRAYSEFTQIFPARMGDTIH
ncbi:MAG: hypothetical protein Ct9H300mP15_10180 [Gemmatimonadota bacterium]|nr:MAG: hypothetical protein Ct9H300mP15_10180 [Gemmatimonadota bacterium]